MRVGEWGARRCARCQADQSTSKVRADAAVFTCPACGYEWAVQRMPSDLEAAGIMKRGPSGRAIPDAAARDVSQSATTSRTGE